MYSVVNVVVVVVVEIGVVMFVVSFARYKFAAAAHYSDLKQLEELFLQLLYIFVNSMLNIIV